MKSAYTIAIFSIIGGVFVHLMVLFVIEIDVPSSSKSSIPEFSVQFIGNLNEKNMPSLLEQAALMDSSPLFMPTKWNTVSRMSDVASLQSATEIFEPFDPQLAILNAKPTAPIEGHSRIADAAVRLPQGPAFVLSRYGRTIVQPALASSAGPTFTVDAIVVDRDIEQMKDALPFSIFNTDQPGSLWNPVKLFLQMREGVPVGLPLISRSSGFADWDSSLQGYFTQLDFYRHLKDGYYQIWVYP